MISLIVSPLFYQIHLLFAQFTSWQLLENQLCFKIKFERINNEFGIIKRFIEPYVNLLNN
jgi:hypothetical protein